MRTITISNLFMATDGLAAAIERVAGYQAMDEHQANDLLKLIKGATQIANEAVAHRVGQIEAATPERAVVTHTEAQFMDETAGFKFEVPANLKANIQKEIDHAQQAPQA